MALLVTSCVACGQTDDHPKDVVCMAGDKVARYHHDCHALMEPPCPSCSWLVQHKGDLRGQDWREQVLAVHEVIPPEQLELRPHERDVVRTRVNGNRPI